MEEARFYLEHFMIDQARATLEKLESLTSEPGVLEPLRAQIEPAGSQTAAGEEIAEISVDEDFPAWCRMTGNALVSMQPPVYLIRRKES